MGAFRFLDGKGVGALGVVPYVHNPMFFNPFNTSPMASESYAALANVLSKSENFTSSTTATYNFASWVALNPFGGGASWKCNLTGIFFRSSCAEMHPFVAFWIKCKCKARHRNTCERKIPNRNAFSYRNRSNGTSTGFLGVLTLRVEIRGGGGGVNLFVSSLVTSFPFAKSKISLPILLVFFTLFLAPVVVAVAVVGTSFSNACNCGSSMPELSNFFRFASRNCSPWYNIFVMNSSVRFLWSIELKNSGEHSNVSSLPDNPLTTKWENFPFCSKVSTICLIWITSTRANPCPSFLANQVPKRDWNAKPFSNMCSFTYWNRTSFLSRGLFAISCVLVISPSPFGPKFSPSRAIAMPRFRAMDSFSL